ncbi:branched-chain amino acid ABC transporter permease [Halomicroarcula sp. F13]|uniref:Branched-chain amino acid ABC transporter permease n=1 Tax=Haloarcula rubra TaxID=2487747 RepID=A0AAW4PQC7_9EURY|nr:branched-chain amino acid ABC transporter permease [Halomicroarcula rubra]MBX0323327.1 branched-chain amino acid ABC transporter permease [Halomicroarcula rubra]
MGIAETVSDGRQLAIERPGAGAVAAVVLYLVADLATKLLGTTVYALGFRVMGGALTVGSLASMVLDGLLVGLAVGLAGIGLSMTYSILDFANFAHGDTVTVGAFLGWVAAYVTANLAVSAPLTDLFLFNGGAQLSASASWVLVLFGLVVAAVGTVAVVLVVDRIVYRPMRDSGNIALLIASIGVALALRYLVAFVFSTQTSGVATSGTRLQLFAGVAITDNEIALLVVAVVLMLGVHLLLQRTKLGKAMRAMADNEDLARVTGIPTERVVRLTWVLGGALAGTSGYLLVLESGTISFNFGWILLLLIFAAVIVGGIGSIYGAMAGGVLIGLVDSLALIWLPSGLTRAAAFAVLIVVLLLRPSGIFGGVSTA